MVYLDTYAWTIRCHNETQLIEYGIKCAEAMREACAVTCEKSGEYIYGPIGKLFVGTAGIIRALELET